MLCYMLMLLPGLEGMLLFDGTNTTKFFEQYNNICKKHFVDSDNKLSKLPWYCILNIRDAIKSMKKWEWKDYLILWKAILLKYKEYNSYQQIYSLQFFEKYKLVIHTKKDNIY